ncbi:MAG: methylenetetrahydrofolate reductase [Candidatus Omnitrophota bacterium]
MGRISLELVPRGEESFSKELETVRDKFPRIDTLNIPDILKFEMRVPESCRVAEKYFTDVIPHIRAVSVDREDDSPCLELFRTSRIREVLVILGDNPEIVSKSKDPCDTTALIRKFKRSRPEIKVYAGIDQWRSSFIEEREYVKRKLDAGADGFFTQPFFDIAHLEMWAKEMRDVEVFWGLAPVVRESSRHYWETKNMVTFPESFECTMKWNQDLAKKVLAFSGDNNFHVYFCPITVDFVEYLKGILL